MKFIEISNGVLHASIAADGSQFTVGNDRIGYRPGSDWASILYGPYINLNLPRNGRVTVEAAAKLKENGGAEEVQALVDAVTEAYSEACIAVREYIDAQAQ